jgi:hypothetical protein
MMLRGTLLLCQLACFCGSITAAPQLSQASSAVMTRGIHSVCFALRSATSGLETCDAVLKFDYEKREIVQWQIEYFLGSFLLGLRFSHVAIPAR